MLPPGNAGPRRAQMEQQLRRNLWQIAKQRIGFSDAQMSQLASTSKRFDDRRRALAVEERAQRMTLRQELLADDKADQDRVAKALDRLHQLQRDRVDLQIEEQREFADLHDAGAARQVRRAPGAGPASRRRRCAASGRIRAPAWAARSRSGRLPTRRTAFSRRRIADRRSHPSGTIHRSAARTGVSMRQHSWAEPWKVKMVEHLRMTTREERERGDRAKPASTPSCSARPVRLHRPPDRLRHLRDERPAVGRHDDGRRGLRRLAELLSSRRGRAEVLRLPAPDPHASGTRRRAHPLAACASSPGERRARQHVLHDDARCTRSWRAESSSTSSSTRRTIPRREHPFKGNVDLDKLDALIQRGRARSTSPYLSVAATVNMAGGQPMQHGEPARACALCHAHGIPVILDATRAVENAYFIQQREPAYASKLARRDSARDLRPDRRLHDVRQEGRAGEHRRLSRG